LEHVRRKRGACLFCARAKRYLDPVYKKALADEEAEVKMTALMIDGRTGMPAFTMPITHGDLAAPAASDS
jgi:glutaredoxin